MLWPGERKDDLGTACSHQHLSSRHNAAEEKKPREIKGKERCANEQETGGLRPSKHKRYIQLHSIQSAVCYGGGFYHCYFSLPIPDLSLLCPLQEFDPRKRSVLTWIGVRYTYEMQSSTLSLSCMGVGTRRGVFVKSTFLVSLALSCLSKNLQLKICPH